MTSSAWTPEHVAQRLAARWPELSGLPVALLGVGSDHRAYAVGAAWVFRVPRHAGGGEALLREARLLAWLAPRVPLPVPRPQFVAEPSAAFPEGIVGATRLDGASGLDAEGPEGSELGAFLHVLHRLDGLGIELEVDHDPAGLEWREAARADLALALQAGVLARPEPWAEIIDRPPPLDIPTLSVIHGDFAAEHVLIGTQGQITGVIDWADAALGDPARDLAGVIHWGGRTLLDAALAAYGPMDDGMVARAAWYALCRALGDVAFGLCEERPEYLRAGRAALDFLTADFAPELGLDTA